MSLPLGMNRSDVSRFVQDVDVAQLYKRGCRYCVNGWITYLAPRRTLVCACAHTRFKKEMQARILVISQGGIDEPWWRAGCEPENWEGAQRFAVGLAGDQTRRDVAALLRRWADDVNEAQVLAELTAEVERARAA